jgi:hypothetical protein
MRELTQRRKDAKAAFGIPKLSLLDQKYSWLFSSFDGKPNLKILCAFAPLRDTFS